MARTHIFKGDPALLKAIQRGADREAEEEKKDAEVLQLVNDHWGQPQTRHGAKQSSSC